MVLPIPAEAASQKVLLGAGILISLAFYFKVIIVKHLFIP